MAFPPPVLPTNRVNATPQPDTHPLDHNQANQAINDITNRIIADETDANLWRGFIAYTTAEVGIPQNPTFGIPLTFGFTSSYKPGWYNFVFAGQVWTVQDFIVRLTVNAALIGESRISSFGNYSPIVIATGASLAVGDVVRIQMAALTGAGGLRAGANLVGNRAYG